jgi:hypothetical protein
MLMMMAVQKQQLEQQQALLLLQQQMGDRTGTSFFGQPAPGSRNSKNSYMYMHMSGNIQDTGSHEAHMCHPTQVHP